MKSLKSTYVARLGFVLVCVAPHHAFAAPSLCDSMKDQAAGKAAMSQLKCHAKAAKLGTTVDHSCVSKTQDKFLDKITKAEGSLDCTSTGNGAVLRSTTDAFVGDIVSSGVTVAQEIFVLEPGDDVATILPFPFPGFPAGIGAFSEPSITAGVAVVAKVRDTEGEVVGFASELEVANFATAVADTAWTLVIPGRGVLFLSQQEDVQPLLDVLVAMLGAGESERSLDPPLELVNTVPGTGMIVGGTDDFVNARGTFRELATLNRVSLIPGQRPLDARVELELNFE